MWIYSSVLLLLWIQGGCRTRRAGGNKASHLPPEVAGLGTTIGDVARLEFTGAIPVEGYGLVAGLPGTGSTHCSPQVLTYLRRFVSSEVPDRRIDVDRLVASKATAVVYLEGNLPQAALRGDRFDVKVTELSGDTGVSLAGGWLYAAELWPKGRGKSTRTLARVKGASAIFMDRLMEDGKGSSTAMVLGGGYVVTPGTPQLNLFTPDFRAASTIRDRINSRFQPDTAIARSDTQVDFTISPRYYQQRIRFFRVLNALYLEQDQIRLAQRLDTLGQALVNKDQKQAFEPLLEGLGTPILPKLKLLLQDENDQVRLAAARCMLNLGSYEGLEALVRMVISSDFTQRREAVRSIIAVGGDTAIRPVLRTLLLQVELDMAQTIFGEVAALYNSSLSEEGLPSRDVSGVLTLHEIPDAPYRLIAVSRTLQARVGLFGPDLICEPKAFVQSKDGHITVDTRAGRGIALVTRRLPKGGGVIGPLNCSHRVADIIQLLCSKPGKLDVNQGGTGLPYAELLPFLQQLCDEGAINAAFWAGPSAVFVQ